LDLLSQAKTALSAKYDFQVRTPVVVEIFPETKDFAVRTFGLPGDSSYLGVCFGSVITANSPATQTAHPNNWQDMLWHEFTHVVTLQLTHNKMPRWLSEGISVYEERQARPAWGKRMTARYREMILGEELVPLTKLSAAFMAPKDLAHLDFAYYESSLAVEFLVERFGQGGLRKVLTELDLGTDINQALEKHGAPGKQLEQDFAQYARERAQRMGPKLDWTKPPAEREAKNTSQVFDLWAETHPDNYWVLMEQAKKQIAAKQYAAALPPLNKLADACPENTGADNVFWLLAEVQRGLKDLEQEREALARVAAMDADAVEAFLRLMELSAAIQDWPTVRENAERYLAVNPLVAPPYRYLAQAEENLGHPTQAIQACQMLLTMDPPDSAEIHYRLAGLMRKTGDPAARRHVLQALEEAPRFRDAHRLLAEMNRETLQPTAGAKP